MTTQKDFAAADRYAKACASTAQSVSGDPSNNVFLCYLASREAEKRLRGAAAPALKMLDDFIAFHDRCNKPCGSYDEECPIGMGEWFEKSERDAIENFRAALKESATP